jgi:hypothetical protein
MSRLALTRREELEGFIEGLFGDNDSLDFPERAHKALGVLAEIRAMLEGVREVADNLAKPASPARSAICASSPGSWNTRCTSWCSPARVPGARCGR